ncbi:MAG: hypothetical protein ACRC62_17185 [Microcoleus sp.]
MVLSRKNEADEIVKSISDWVDGVDEVVDFSGKHNNGITRGTGYKACDRLQKNFGFVVKDKVHGYLVTQEGEQELLEHRSLWK